MGFKSITTALLAGTALLTAPAVAGAAPGVPLPDARLYCGTPLTAVTSFAFGNPTADAFWVNKQKWNILYEAHYITDGLVTQGSVALRDGPVPQNDAAHTYALEPTRKPSDSPFGQKIGQTDKLTCEIVSLWPQTLTGVPDFTVVAPMILSRTAD
ncbi:MAG TPA: hypothetical protein VE441_01595 [Mycobacterium sp.]|jgi:hypothetical protein|nr:hypothetical protein [Mycobacterium sp.]